jgi:subtilisin-like proprotein convertase family protein
MKLKLLILVALLNTFGLQAALFTLSSGTLNTAVPDGNVNGLQSTLTFNDAYFDNVTDVNVRLNISGGYNGDLYVYLTHGSGISILLNRTGRTGANSFGYGDAGFNITLDDAAATDIHAYGGNGGNQLTGTWQPDARNSDPALVLQIAPRNAFLNAFNGLDANGGWTLFIADVSGGDVSTLVSWELDITAVPEPTTVALGVFGGMLALGGGLRAWRKRARA